MTILSEDFAEACSLPHAAITADERDWLAERIVHDLGQEHPGPRPATS